MPRSLAARMIALELQRLGVPDAERHAVELLDRVDVEVERLRVSRVRLSDDWLGQTTSSPGEIW